MQSCHFFLVNTDKKFQHVVVLTNLTCIHIPAPKSFEQLYAEQLALKRSRMFPLLQRGKVDCHEMLFSKNETTQPGGHTTFDLEMAKFAPCFAASQSSLIFVIAALLARNVIFCLNNALLVLPPWTLIQTTGLT